MSMFCCLLQLATFFEREERKGKLIKYDIETSMFQNELKKSLKMNLYHHSKYLDGIYDMCRWVDMIHFPK